MVNLSRQKWTLGYSETQLQFPEETVEAWVPSDVQLVWQRAKNMPDYNFGKNYLEYKWMEDKFWHYQTEFTLDAAKEDSEPYLVFWGIDYRYTILINGDILADGEGMYTPVVLRLAGYEGRNVVCEVVIHPIPKVPGAPEDRSQAAMCCKPPAPYGWDWHPRLVPSGIFDDVLLQWLPKAHISESDFAYELSDELDSVDFTAKIKTNAVKGKIVAQITGAEGGLVAQTCADVSEKHDGAYELKMSFDDPRLWWCVRQGEQYRYNYEAILYGGDGRELHRISRKVGFRRVKLLMNDDDWSNDGFPATQARFPATLELNGRKIFGKGSNLVPTEIFHSLMDESVYRAVLEPALECNMNILRLWGGGIINKEAFFELCDELGIMIWQEFPLACNDYPDDRHYLETLDRESISIIKRLKSHPCVVLWCGGNELFNGWSKMTNQSLALRLLDKNCYENDPHTPFIMTSPLYGMGHGCYLNLRTPERECLTDFVEYYRTAYTEFGAPAPAPMSYIKKYCPEDELDRIDDGTCWVDHHALYAWCSRDTWLRPDEIKGYYGEKASNEELFDCGLELQGESYKGMFEEARRKWPRTSLALNWCFNEPWPCFANNSLIMYPAVKRPAYYAVKEALRDRMLSAKLTRLRWHIGEELNFDVYALNDLPEELKGCEYEAYYIADGKRVDIGKSSFNGVAPVSSVKLASFCFRVPVSGDGRFTLYVEAKNDALSSSYIIYTPYKD